MMNIFNLKQFLLFTVDMGEKAVEKPPGEQLVTL